LTIDVATALSFAKLRFSACFFLIFSVFLKAGSKSTELKPHHYYSYAPRLLGRKARLRRTAMAEAKMKTSKSRQSFRHHFFPKTESDKPESSYLCARRNTR